MDGKVVISTKLDNSGLEKGIKSVSGILGGLGKVVGATCASIAAAFSAAALAVTKMATDAYADYEQLTGGVETLFKASADKVKAYAEDAFYTVGMSANAYMETVTSFSASLISSLGGDTEKAADVANMALVDMSDNANKMGTNIESIKIAYQGFAKQNYTMLDNLKLGYGGTKTEMERLLKDAQALTGVKYDISNLADVYTAIHVIQENLGIAGTTAKEAEKTISGSAAMTKAAWENVLTAIAGGGDLDKAINNLVFSISKYFENIVPVVERSLSGIGELIRKIAPQLVQTVAKALIQALPSLLDAVYQMVLGLAEGIYQGIVALFSGDSVTEQATAQLNEVADSASDAAKAEGDLADGIKEADKAAKRSLAGFDELNILQTNTGDTTEAGSAVANSAGVTVDASVAVGGQVKDNISPKLEGLIDKIKGFGKQVKKAFQPTLDAWGDSFKSLAPAAQDAGARISEAWTSLWDDSLAPFGEYVTTDFVPSITNTFSETFAPIFADVMPTAMDTWTTDFENGTMVVEEACGWLEEAFENVKTVFSDMCTSISDNWDIYGGNLLQGFTDFKDGLWEIWWSIYYEIIDPVLSSCADTFTWLWDEHLKPLWDDIVEFVMSVSDNLMVFWNEVIQPIVDWLVSVLGPIVTRVVSAIVDAVGIVIAVVSDVVGGILTFLDGLIQFITGIFSGDWERAWDGIVKMFEGIWNAIEGVVKGVINSVIWILNQMIAAVYDAVAGVVNGLGDIVKGIGDLLGQDWGFSIPTQPPAIPYLAKGAVLPPNKPFMAVVGDQRHGTNIEAPLSTIQEAVASVMADFSANNMAGHEATIGVLQEILQAVLGIQIGDDVIGNAVNRYNHKVATARGTYL